MVGFAKGMTPDGEMAHIREAFSAATATIYAWPNMQEARDAAKALQDLIKDLQGEAADFRGYLAAYVMDTHGLSMEEIAQFLEVSRPQAHKIITRARRKGNPVTEPLTLPEQPHIALAVITSDQGVLVAKRIDGIPPWTFPGGEMEVGETGEEALRRLVAAETDLDVIEVRFIGRRIHPRTSRVITYGHVKVAEGEPRNGDPGDLELVRWASIDETGALMPDMFSSVRQYLDELQRTA